MNKTIISCNSAPFAIGPYSQAVKACNLIFVSGQIPIDPKTGEIEAKDIEGQTKQVLENIKNILTAAGSSLDKVVKTTVYLTDLSDYDCVNKTYGTFFQGSFPARAAVEVSRLPKGVGVEIEAVAMS